MDGSPISWQPLRFRLELDRTHGGRLEGRIGPYGREAWTVFSGVLELLKVLEELVEDDVSGLTEPVYDPKIEKG